ncbi:MAG: UDP-N-acetylglucosamine 2-epimerase (hydrolyzing) [Chloroflexi bacterium]|jgi:UDP-hydrolysing UDP-N-acetyl-D-glucosamine 2-epimerase|nr:UDP-N-acetylglucosamine 2-epimerase (hydrolyzing) [Chloroflexota bacterium]
MRIIGVVTVGRSDYGIYVPLLHQIQADPELRLHLIVAGMHLSPEFGMTVQQIRADGFRIDEQIEMSLSSDTPEGVAKTIGLGMIGFSQAFARSRPDILIVLGDRFEMHAAALAALPFKIPVAHIHGGEITQGAIDDALRHSMTKLSHLHFVSTQEYARRVIQLGEEPWRVTVSGAPGLDNLRHIQLLTREELFAQFGIPYDEINFLVVTYHPVTLEYEHAEWQTAELLAALKIVNLPVVFSQPNADTGGRVIARMLADFVDAHSNAYMIHNLGTQGYFSMMAHAAAMVGNSSSGIIEAASFELPVVNLGTRQAGRVRGANVIDVEYPREAVLDGIRLALSPQFRADLRGMKNPYREGEAAQIIIAALKKAQFDEKLIVKQFYDFGGDPDIR